MPGYGKAPLNKNPDGITPWIMYPVDQVASLPTIITNDGKLRYRETPTIQSPNTASVVNGGSIVLDNASVGNKALIFYADVVSSIAGQIQLLDGATLIYETTLQANLVFVLPFNYLSPYLALLANTNRSIKNNTGSTSTFYTNIWYSNVTP